MSYYGWAGYGWKNASKVQADIIVPKTSGPVGSVAFWAGLGTGAPGIQQTGISANWNGKNMTYTAWYQMYPADPVAFDPAKYPVAHGDHLRFYVARSGTSYDLEILNYTKPWHAVTKHAYPHAPIQAEVVCEAFGPEPCGFEPTTFSGISGNVATRYDWPFGMATVKKINARKIQVIRL